MELPEWTNEYYPEKLQHLTDQSYVYNAFNPELKRFKGGVFVKKVIADWKSKVTGNLKTKIFLYAGHDSSVTNILSAFNVWEPQFPGYGIAGILELNQNKKTGEFGVEIFLRNSTVTDPVRLTIPGCSGFCKLEELETLLKDNIPVDRESECKPKAEGFTEAPLGGP